jgi:tetratricopeptide (TPR) repeat protein
MKFIGKQIGNHRLVAAINSGSYHSGRGRALYTLKCYEEAMAAFKEAARLAPKVPLYVKTQGEIL